jgi:hypothetical protein
MNFWQVVLPFFHDLFIKAALFHYYVDLVIYIQ